MSSAAALADAVGVEEKEAPVVMRRGVVEGELLLDELRLHPKGVVRRSERVGQRRHSLLEDWHPIRDVASNEQHRVGMAVDVRLLLDPVEVELI